MAGDLPTAGYDSTAALLKEGYDFISNRCAELDTDIFRTRILARPVVCMRGAEAAEVFYDGDRFTREGAMPQTTLRLLQDKGSVQLLDGAAHRQRKSMFISILFDDEQVNALAAKFDALWRNALPRWAQADRVSLLQESAALLAEAACNWAGVPFEEAGGRRFARDLDDMVQNAGRFGPRNWRALARRRATERTVRGFIESHRAGALPLPPSAPLRIISQFRDEQGNVLDVDQATVELLNLLRPIVAIDRFIVDCAIALAQHPEWRDRFAAGEEAMLRPFVEEVRRLYPFFPFIGGRVRQPFAWRGHDFAKGEWVLLDLYGTDHDPRSFDAPEEFRPERALRWSNQGHAFIPQGAGDARHTHRCPGEKVTVELMAVAVRLLSCIDYKVDPEALDLPKGQFPPRPKNGLELRDLRMGASTGH